MDRPGARPVRAGGPRARTDFAPPGSLSRPPRARTLARSLAAGATVKPTRVLLARLPRILRDILREIIAAQPDMTVVAEVDDAEDLVAVAAPYAPDVLVVGLAA